MSLEQRIANIEHHLQINVPKIWFVQDNQDDIPMYRDMETREEKIWDESLAGENDILIHYTNLKKENAENNSL